MNRKGEMTNGGDSLFFIASAAATTRVFLVVFVECKTCLTTVTCSVMLTLYKV